MSISQSLVTVESLESDSPHDIAKRLNIGYAGDMSPFNGGYFYETDNVQFGYASAVEFSHGDGMIFVESIVIDIADDSEILQFCADNGIVHVGGINNFARAEISHMMGNKYVSEDFSGRFAHSMPESWNNAERRLFAKSANWIAALSPDGNQ